MLIAHKIALDPTYKQRTYFAQAAGTARFVYNWGLAEWKRQYEAGEHPTAMGLKKQFNRSKYVRYPWLREIHRDAHSQPFTYLGSAFANFFRGTTNYPIFKKRGVHDSFYVANDRMAFAEKTVRLPQIGWVRLQEPLRFDGKLMGATVSREADRWFIAIQVDVGDYTKRRSADEVLGVDLGINATMTLSTGEQLSGPKSLRQAQKRLRRAQRAHMRKQRRSRNRAKSKRKLARLHRRVRDQRKDFLHKATTSLCMRAKCIVVEDLPVRGMIKNPALALSISDEAWGEIRRQLAYKASIYGVDLIVADRFFPSSKTCHQCGQVCASLRLADRVFQCACGWEVDRDLNAAMNLRTLGLRGSDACGDRPCGGTGSDPVYEHPVVEAGTTPCSTHVLTK